MSYVKLENRPTSWWRCQAASVGQMIDTGWTVWSVCNGCHLVMPADLEWYGWKFGDGHSLWNWHPTCRRFGCKGLVSFYGTPPTINRCMELKAEWPGSWSDDRPPTIPARKPPDKRTPPLPEPNAPEAARRFR